MLVPISWLRDYVDIDIPIELLAERLTVAGLEVAHLKYIGLPQATVPGVLMPRSDHLVWDRDKLLLGRIVEVKAHSNADRLVLALVDYGGARIGTVCHRREQSLRIQRSGRDQSADLGCLRDEGRDRLGRA